MRGGPLGPLHGVPMSFKDLTPTAGIRTTFGSKIYEHNVPAEDAVVVERARRAGAIVLGKTNTPEFGCKGVTDNRIFGPTRNPWNLDRMAGGSSGGAAAAAGRRTRADRRGQRPRRLHPHAGGRVRRRRPQADRRPRAPLSRAERLDVVLASGAHGTHGARRRAAPERPGGAGRTRSASRCRPPARTSRARPTAASRVCGWPGAPTSATRRSIPRSPRSARRPPSASRSSAARWRRPRRDSRTPSRSSST